MTALILRRTRTIRRLDDFLHARRPLMNFIGLARKRYIRRDPGGSVEGPRPWENPASRPSASQRECISGKSAARAHAPPLPRSRGLERRPSGHKTALPAGIEPGVPALVVAASRHRSGGARVRPKAPDVAHQHELCPMPGSDAATDRSRPRRPARASFLGPRRSRAGSIRQRNPARRWPLARVPEPGPRDRSRHSARHEYPGAPLSSRRHRRRRHQEIGRAAIDCANSGHRAAGRRPRDRAGFVIVNHLGWICTCIQSKIAVAVSLTS